MGRSSQAEKIETHHRLLRAAESEFKRHGFGGVGVDGVAKAAGVTSGAFYANFASKAEIFREALASGLGDLRNGIAAWRARGDARWLRKFAAWYLSDERRADLSSSCALPVLSLEAARSGDDTRSSYTKHFSEIVRELQGGLVGKSRENDAIAILALLAGGMTIAHAVNDEALGKRIAKAVTDAIVRIGGEA